MKIALRQWFSSATLLCLLAVISSAQTEANPATQAQAVIPPCEILSFKIVSYYNPLLERSSEASADKRDLPRTPNEQVSNARRDSNRSHQERANEIGVPPGAAPTIKVLSPAEWVYLSVKNTGAKPIKAIVWDFAFMRMEAGKVVSRYEVATQVEIKAGAKKTLKQSLPPGATRCQVVNVSVGATPNDKAKTFESVCGRGFNDPSQLNEKQEPATIKRIEYADGSVWQPL